MILIPFAILIFGLGLICGIKLTNWAMKRRWLQQMELLRRYEEYS